MRALGVGLWLVGAAAGGLAQLGPAPDPVGADATFVEVAEVRVHGEGPGTLSQAEIGALEVELSRVAGGWVAPRRDLPRERVRIGDLGAEPLRLYGSAIESIEDAVARAHARAGRAGVSVELRPGAVRYERDGVERRNLVVELRSVGESGSAAVPASPDRVGADAVLVTVRALALDGLAGLGISEDQLLSTAVELSWDGERIPAGFVAPLPGRRTQNVK